MNVIKCKFLMDGKPISKEYSYLTKVPVQIGDIVQADTVHGVADLVVTGVNVPAEEVESIKDKLKYIIRKKEDK